MSVTKRDLQLNANILADGQRISNTNNYIYLGNKITNNGRNEADIVQRIGMAKTTFADMEKFNQSKYWIAMKNKDAKLFCVASIVNGCERGHLRRE